MSTAVDRNVFDPGQLDAYLDRVNVWDEGDVVPTPWPSINRRCGGFGGGAGLSHGWYVVFGGSTGAGKSLAALNMARQALLRKHRVGFVSLEMSPEQLMTRLYAMLFNVEVRRIQPGRHYDPKTAESLKRRIGQSLDDWPGAQFRVNERQMRNLPDMLALMEHWRTEWGIRVFVVDYMQLCRVPDEEKTHKRIQTVSAEVCDFAHESECLVIALSQFHAAARRDKSAPPGVDSLYGGVDLGNDADLALLLDHSRYERPEDHIARTYLVLDKNREGPTVDQVPVLWDYRTLSIREALPDEEHQWPE